MKSWQHLRNSTRSCDENSSRLLPSQGLVARFVHTSACYKVVWLCSKHWCGWALVLCCVLISVCCLPLYNEDLVTCFGNTAWNFLYTVHAEWLLIFPVFVWHHSDAEFSEPVICHNYLTLSLFHPLQHSLFITCYPFSTVYVILITSQRLLHLVYIIAANSDCLFSVFLVVSTSDLPHLAWHDLAHVRSHHIVFTFISVCFPDVICETLYPFTL